MSNPEFYGQEWEIDFDELYSHKPDKPEKLNIWQRILRFFNPTRNKEVNTKKE